MSAVVELMHRRGEPVRHLTVLPGHCYRATAWQEGGFFGFSEGFNLGKGHPVDGEDAHWVDESGVLSGSSAADHIADAPDVVGWAVVVASGDLLPPDPLGRAMFTGPVEEPYWGGYVEQFEVTRAVRAATLGARWVQVGKHWVVGIHHDGTTTGVWI